MLFILSATDALPPQTTNSNTMYRIQLLVWCVYVAYPNTPPPDNAHHKCSHQGAVIFREKGVSSSWQGLLATNVTELLRKKQADVWYFQRLTKTHLKVSDCCAVQHIENHRHIPSKRRPIRRVHQKRGITQRF